MLEVFRSPRRATVWFVEATLLAILVTLAVGLPRSEDHAPGFALFAQALGVSVVAQGSLYYHGLYNLEPLGTGRLFLTTLRALAIAAVLLLGICWFLPDAAIGGLALLAPLGAAALILPAWRAAFERVSRSESFCRRAVVLGSGELALACAALLREGGDARLRLTGRLVRDDGPMEGPEVIGRYRDLARVVEQHGVCRVIVACADRRGAFPVDALLTLKLRGVEIEEGIEFYERATGKILVKDLLPSQIIFSRGFHVRRRTLVAKRVFDVVSAGLGLLFAMPLMLLTAAAIKLDSPGPALYSQVRLGEFGRRFHIHKFRSMRTDAEKNGAVWAAEADPRVTRVGNVIRKLRIDELPQLWNVLVGEMSLVGPRPERPEFTSMLEREIPYFRQRLCVKPGVTGHAQVRCRYGASLEDAVEKLQHDLYYMKRMSIWFDMSILIDTVKVVLLRIGSR